MSEDQTQPNEAPNEAPSEQPQPRGITRITVQGFKSLRDETSIEIRPLTILAGANSSGKSSIMQPLLLLKQTFDDHGFRSWLKLSGPLVHFNRTNQLFFRLESGYTAPEFFVALDINGKTRTVYYWIDKESGILDVDGGWNDVIDWFVNEGRSEILYVSGYRGELERGYELIPVSYDKSSNSLEYADLFERYAASIVYFWQQHSSVKMQQLSIVLGEKGLGLANSVKANQITDVDVEILIDEGQGYISIADVGRAVASVLPVVVALLVAEPGQLVYIEQPELHLHPDAQAKMAELLADAARRGVRVVVETHSDILLLAIQTLVAQYAADNEHGLDPSLVKLHWFSRDDEGVTHVQSADLDEAGTFGEWPEDFGQIRFKQLRDFLTYSMERPTEATQVEKAKANGRSHNRKNGRNGKSETGQEQGAVTTNAEVAE